MSQLHTAQTLPVVPFRASCEINKQHLAQVPSSAQTTQRFGVSRGLISRRPTTTVAIFSPSLGVVPRTHTTTPAENNTPPKFPQLNLDRAGERERETSVYPEKNSGVADPAREIDRESGRAGQGSRDNRIKNYALIYRPESTLIKRPHDDTRMRPRVGVCVQAKSVTDQHMHRHRIAREPARNGHRISVFKAEFLFFASSSCFSFFTSETPDHCR